MSKHIKEASQEPGLLRFSTLGSVDDGKSTLIGRLLHDAKGIFEDQLASIKKASGQMENDEQIDFSLATDGLKAEREQGITIDVAYRYFSTPKRKFIIADTPGHEQYTRNMATGASTANLAIILIDARNGVVTQTKRHAFIASLLGIPRVVVAVNKMDAVGYSQATFAAIEAEFTAFATKLGFADLKFIPVSALKGDNVAKRSAQIPWYAGECVLEYLENVYVASDRNLIDLRFPVQYVSRPHQDFRGYCGQISGGVIKKGEEILILPSMKRSRIKSIVTFDGELDYAFAPMSVNVTLADEIDISRGDMIVHPANVPHVDSRLEAMMVWLDEAPLSPDRSYLIKHTSRSARAQVEQIRYRVDVNTLSRTEANQLALNEVGRVAIRTNQPLFFDSYEKNRATGSFILVDSMTHHTVAAGMIIDRRPSERIPSNDQRTDPAATTCPACGGSEFQPAFIYHEPPKGEVSFALKPGTKYEREYRACVRCGHYLAFHEMDLSDLYAGAYVNATYADAAGIARTFQRIISLPPDKSDNTGRVAFIQAFAKRHFGSKLDALRALDVGSGLGVFPYAMKQAGWNITALDPDSRAVAHIQSMGITAVCADFFDVKDLGPFDLITFNKVIEHVPDPAAMLHKAATLLRNEKSVIYLEVPDAEAASREGKEREEFYIDHLHAYSFASLCLQAGRAGLFPVAVERLQEPSTKYTIRGFFTRAGQTSG